MVGIAQGDFGYVKTTVARQTAVKHLQKVPASSLKSDHHLNRQDVFGSLVLL